MTINYKSKNSKESGISTCEIGEDFIVIEFNNKKQYKYSYMSTGFKDVEEMKMCALLSEGLNTYILTNKTKYERKKSILEKASSQFSTLVTSFSWL